jgi:benzil reductase ((S)-benzoin forming)
MNNILITGTSSGLGLELAKQLSVKYNVFGISRSRTELNIYQAICDLSKIENIESTLDRLLFDANIDTVIFNASALGELKIAQKINYSELKYLFDLNFFSIKIILDYLLKNQKLKRVITISSGASIKPYYGWFSYCTTKAALNHLISCYAIENKDIKFISLAPGHIKSKMQDYISTIDSREIPSVKKFQETYDNMPSPKNVAAKILFKMDDILSFESGSFVDLRDLKL